MPSIISGYSFPSEGPTLQLDELGAGPTRRSFVPVRGRPWTLVWGQKRYCSGYRDLATRTSSPCPSQTTITGKSDQCFACDQRTGFNPSFYNVDPLTISPQQQRYNQNEHFVYLAAFSADTAKVGISSESRVLGRLREQGARRAVIVARSSDAYGARAHEEAIHQWLYLPEQIRSSRKLALLSERFDDHAVCAYLQSLRVRAERDLELPSLDQPILSFDTDYLGDNVLEPPLVDMTEVSPAMISGIGVGMIGNILILREADRQLAISLKSLIGCEVELSEQVRPNVARPPQQMGFGF